MWQEHLAGTEQIPHLVHAVHEGALDHIERPSPLASRLLGVVHDVARDPVYERVSETILHRTGSPFLVAHHLLLRRPGVLPGARRQALGRVGTPVEEHVLHRLQKVGRHVVVDRECSGVDDGHVQTRLDGVVEERRVHRFAHSRAPTIRERNVA